jgi:hypothetical protein
MWSLFEAGGWEGIHIEKDRLMPTVKKSVNLYLLELVNHESVA